MMSIKLKQEEKYMSYIKQNEKVIARAKELLQQLGYDDLSIDEIENLENLQWISYCTGLDGQDYLWYLDCDSVEAVIRISDGKYIAAPDERKDIFGDFDHI